MNTMNDMMKTMDHEPNYKIALTIYVLQAAGLVFGLPFLIAVVMYYCMRKNFDPHSWIFSHFRWQIRTFWFGLLWTVIGGILLWVLVGYFILVINLIWVIYRIAKGWIYLYEKKSLDTK